jgi:O-methyltransferase involved in polyketide biosynthesis
MQRETHIELEGANKTLLLPLWARAKECGRDNTIFIDSRAKQIVEDLRTIKNYKNTFDEMDKTFDKYYQLSQIIRAKCLDDEVRNFINKNPSATTVNIGAGFDTTFDRIDNRMLKWYDLDMPEVIEL